MTIRPPLDHVRTPDPRAIRTMARAGESLLRGELRDPLSGDTEVGDNVDGSQLLHGRKIALPAEGVPAAFNQPGGGGREGARLTTHVIAILGGLLAEGV